MKRDNSLDFFKGIATIWIILIHTVFWSGESYLPFWSQAISLIIDVPLFICISGMGFNYSNSFMKTLKNIFSLWKKYLCFLIFYFLIIKLLLM